MTLMTDEVYLLIIISKTKVYGNQWLALTLMSIDAPECVGSALKNQRAVQRVKGWFCSAVLDLVHTTFTQ